MTGFREQIGSSAGQNRDSLGLAAKVNPPPELDSRAAAPAEARHQIDAPLRYGAPAGTRSAGAAVPRMARRSTSAAAVAPGS